MRITGMDNSKSQAVTWTGLEITKMLYTRPILATFTSSETVKLQLFSLVENRSVQWIFLFESRMKGRCSKVEDKTSGHVRQCSIFLPDIVSEMKQFQPDIETFWPDIVRRLFLGLICDQSGQSSMSIKITTKSFNLCHIPF